MSIIQILGPGCQKCQVLYDRTKQAVEEIGRPCEIEKITDIQDIVGFGVMSTPALVVDGTLKLEGHVPTVAQLKEILS
jgi:small redox-active disulfide protein 2